MSSLQDKDFIKKAQSNSNLSKEIGDFQIKNINKHIELKEFEKSFRKEG